MNTLAFVLTLLGAVLVEVGGQHLYKAGYPTLATLCSIVVIFVAFVIGDQWGKR